MADMLKCLSCSSLCFLYMTCEKCSCTSEVFVCLLYKVGLSESRTPFFFYPPAFFFFFKSYSSTDFYTAELFFEDSCKLRSPAILRNPILAQSSVVFSQPNLGYPRFELLFLLIQGPHSTTTIFRTAALILFTKKAKKTLLFSSSSPYRFSYP